MKRFFYGSSRLMRAYNSEKMPVTCPSDSGFGFRKSFVVRRMLGAVYLFQKPSICGLLHPSSGGSADVVRQEIRIVPGTTAFRGSTIHFPCPTVAVWCVPCEPTAETGPIKLLKCPDRSHHACVTYPGDPAVLSSIMDFRLLRRALPMVSGYFQNTKIYRFRISKPSR